MSDFNKWCGSGRVVKDAELRYTPNQTPVADVSICSNRVYNKGDERVEEATFVDVTIWGKQAESLSQYLTKGTYVLVEGRLKLDQWEKDGEKRQKLKVVADQVNLGPKSSGGSGGSSDSGGDEDTPF